MPIPGLQGPGKSYSMLLELDANVEDVNAFASLSSPVGPVKVYIHVFTGVTVGSTSNSNAALTIGAFHSDSVILLLNEGRIVGKGAIGGVGASNDGVSTGIAGNKHGGGGGGGAGANSVGGDGETPATDGANGTESAGGTAGANGTGGSVEVRQVTAGGDAGDALDAGGHSMFINNASGEIWGGGGGGHGGDIQRLGLVASDGGLPGADGDVDGIIFLAAAAGESGSAVVNSSNVVVASGGSDPNVKGAIS